MVKDLELTLILLMDAWVLLPLFLVSCSFWGRDYRTFFIFTISRGSFEIQNRGNIYKHFFRKEKKKKIFENLKSIQMIEKNIHFSFITFMY